MRYVLLLSIVGISFVVNSTYEQITLIFKSKTYFQMKYYIKMVFRTINKFRCFCVKFKR